MTIPVIALIGSSNVGKSILFNKLTKTNDAIVASIPGSTRDRRYGYITWKQYTYIIIDTGGIYHTSTDIEYYITEQSLIAVEESDIIFFVIDGYSGISKNDYKIVQYLRRQNKTTIIIVNKIDKNHCQNSVYDYRQLKISNNIIFISALYRRGLNNILDYLFLFSIKKISRINNLSTVNIENSSVSKKNNIKYIVHNTNTILPISSNFISLSIKLAVIGSPNVGKSTLINLLLGKKRMIVHNIPGTTRDSIYIPMIYQKQVFTLIDTAGIRKNIKLRENIEQNSIIQTLQAINNANVVLLVINVCENLSNQDLSFIHFIFNRGKSLVIIVNKWDSIPNENRYQTQTYINNKINDSNLIKVHFISALYDDSINDLFQSILESYKCSIRPIQTSLLTNILHKAIQKNAPPLFCGKRAKLKYAHPSGYHPLSITIHGTHIYGIPDNYKRYLVKYFRYALNMIGAPIHINFRVNSNPFDI